MSEPASCDEERVPILVDKRETIIPADSWHRRMLTVMIATFLLVSGLWAAAAPHTATTHTAAATADTSLVAEPEVGIVYIIRHAEFGIGDKLLNISEGWFGSGCLTAAGKARADALPQAFSDHPSPKHGTFLTPKALFANHYTDHVDCQRCEQSLIPLSHHLNVSIEGYPGWPFAFHQMPHVAKAIKHKLKESVSPILVDWEHNWIPTLVHELGVPKVHIPCWAKDDFDTIYVLRYNSTQDLTHFSIGSMNISITSVSHDRWMRLSKAVEGVSSLKKLDLPGAVEGVDEQAALNPDVMVHAVAPFWACFGKGFG